MSRGPGQIWEKSFPCKQRFHEPRPLDSNISTVLPQHFAHLSQDEDIPELDGERFPEVLDEANFQEDNREALDVLVYARTKIGMLEEKEM